MLAFFPFFAFVVANIADSHAENTVFFSGHFDDLLFEIGAFFHEILRQNLGFGEPCEFAQAKRDKHNNRNYNCKNKYYENDSDSPFSRAEVLGVVLESVGIPLVVEDMQKAPEYTPDPLVVECAQKRFEKFKYKIDIHGITR